MRLTGKEAALAALESGLPVCLNLFNVMVATYDPDTGERVCRPVEEAGVYTYQWPAPPAALMVDVRRLALCIEDPAMIKDIMAAAGQGIRVLTVTGFDACGFAVLARTPAFMAAIRKRYIRMGGNQDWEHEPSEYITLRLEDVFLDVPDLPAAPIAVNVPPTFWAGKTPQSIHTAMTAAGYADGVIALVLHDRCEYTKTEKGKPFLPGEHDDSSHVRKFNELVKQSASRYIITFNN